MRRKSALSDFQVAIVTDDVAQLKLHLESGARVNPPAAKRAFHQIPLILAADANAIQCLPVLLAQGADLRIRDDRGHSALHYAKSDEAIDILIAAGIPVDDRGPSQWTPLYSAIVEGDYLGNDPQYIRRVARLLHHGANPNANCGWRTPFGHALWGCRSQQVVRLLLDHGANAHLLSCDGENAFHLTVEMVVNDDDVWPIYQWLAEKGVDVNRPRDDGVSRLELVVTEGSAEQVRALLRLGANHDILSPLPSATKDYVIAPIIFHAVGDPVMFAALVEAGANTSTADSAGRTCEAYIEELIAEAIASPSPAAVEIGWQKRLEECMAILRGASNR